MPSIDPHAPIGLLGRDAEMGALRALVEQSKTRGRAVLITGPTGVGKGRLVSELRRDLRTAGRPCVTARCVLDDDRPHGPLADLLGSAARMLAELGIPHPHTLQAMERMAGYGQTGELARGRGFRSTIRQALIEVSRLGAPVLALHELHLARPGFRRLIGDLLENLLTDPAFEWAPEAETAEPPFRGLLVFTFCDGPEMAPLVNAARASESIRHLEVPPLDAAGVRSWLDTPAVVQRLLAASGGMPAALDLLLDALPRDVEAAWARRLADLPAPARPLLEALAVRGGSCTLDELADLVDIPHAPWAELTPLVETGLLLRSLERGLVRFRFCTPEARERFLTTVAPARRRALHLRIAERLALTARNSAAESIARHYVAGGAQAKAVPFAVAAVDRLQSACAFERAAALLAGVVDGCASQDAAPLLDRLAELHLEAGAVDDARTALAQLAANGPEQESAQVALRLAELNARAGDQAEAARVAHQALKDAPESNRLPLTAVAAEAAYQLGDLTQARRLCEALPSDELDGVDASALSLRNTLGKVHLASESLDEAQALFTRNLEVARAQADAVQQARAQTNLGVVSLQRGDQEAALRLFAQTHELAAAHGDVRHLALSVENLGVLYHRRKAFSRALQYYHQSTVAFRQLGHRRQLATTALNLADLYLTLGDAPRARRLAHIAGELIDRGGYRHLIAQKRMLDGDHARLVGELDAAATHYGAARTLLESGGSNQRLGSVLWAQAELALRQGQVDTAEATLAEAQAVPGSQSDAFAARLRMTQAGVAAANDQLDAALVALEAAEGLAADDHETRWQVQARLADVHWQRADRPATLQSLAAAVETIESVAATLPSALRTTYLDAAPRRAVREALRRVRAGVAQPGVLTANPEPTALRRQRGRYQPVWAERYPKIIGCSAALHSVFNALDRVSGSDSMVLIRGESGTGKELVASALHTHSRRSSGPFVKVNCAAFVETLLLSELFGHEKGAFTGAVSSKRGRFELAHGGTLFLDEIGDISPNTQVALLRVLQEGTFERVGGQQTLKTDVRVICATHRDLESMVQAGSFRADLYYRLRGVIIEVPPLRDRPEDLLALVRHFLSRRSQRRPLTVDRAAMASLLQHDWPGNVRELENVIRSVALFADGNRIGLHELAELGDIFRPPDDAALERLARLEAQADAEPVLTAATQAPAVVPTPPDDGSADAEDAVFDEVWLQRMLKEEGSLSDLKKRIEFEAIARALTASGGNITQAAAKLGMKRPRLSQIIHGNPALGEIKREVSNR